MPSTWTGCHPPPVPSQPAAAVVTFSGSRSDASQAREEPARATTSLGRVAEAGTDWPPTTDTHPHPHRRGPQRGASTWADPRHLLRPSRQATRRRAEGATLDELARSYNVGISTIHRVTHFAG
jgi:hypothetical protein